jgi:aminopeptidase
MRAKWMFLLLAPVLAAVLAAVLTGSSSKKTKPIDYEDLARRLVNQCAAIREGDYVLVNGGVRDIELLEDIAVNVRKVGAYPILTVGSDRLTRRMYTDVPEKYDSTMARFDEKIYSVITAGILVDYNEAPDVLDGIPPERLATVSKVYEPLSQMLMKRGFRQVELGNTLYPSASKAKMYGLSLEQLTSIFWSGVDVDYRRLRETGEKAKAILKGGDVIRVTNPNGTDLKFGIKGRQVFVSDGAISANGEKQGATASLVWLPAGEVYVTPVPGSAEGTVVVDRQFFQGKEIRKLILKFVGGRLKSMTAESGLEPLKKYYDAQGSGKEIFALIDIGINPNVRLIKGSKMLSYVTAGMVSINIGGNDWAGGENTIAYGLTSFIPGSTLTLDGKTLVENGTLMF